MKIHFFNLTKPWSVPGLLAFLALFLLVGAAQAASYVFPGELPSGCSGSGPSYTCGTLTLNWGDTIKIESPKPATITINGNFTTAGGNQINTSGSTADLTLVVNGTLTTGYDTRIVGNITTQGASGNVIIGGCSACTPVTGSVTASGTLALTSNTSRITGNANVTGAATLAYGSRIDGTTTAASIDCLNNSSGGCVFGDTITATTGRVLLGYDAKVTGNVIAQATSGGIITVGGSGTRLQVSGCVMTNSTAAGSINFNNWNSSAGGVCCQSGGSCLATSNACYANSSNPAYPLSTAACAALVAPNQVKVGSCTVSGVTASYSTIQAAVDAVADGGTITVCKGTYAERVDVNKNNLTLVGQTGNPDDVIVRYTRSGESAGQEALTINGNNVTLSALTIIADGSSRWHGVNLVGANPHLTSVKVSSNSDGPNAGTSAIVLKGATNVVIDGTSTVTTTLGYGITNIYGSTTAIVNPTFSGLTINAGARGLYIAPRDFTRSDVNVAGAVNLSNVTVTTTRWDAVRLYSAGGVTHTIDNVTATANATKGGDAYAFVLSNASRTGTKLNLTNSTFTSYATDVNGYGALSLTGLSGGTVSGSTIQSPVGPTFIYNNVTGVTFSGNTFKTTQKTSNYGTLWNYANSSGNVFTGNCIYGVKRLASVGADKLDNGSKGNYWSDNANCGTPNSSGICSNAYTSFGDGGAKDNYPLSSCGSSTTLTCVSPLDSGFSSSDWYTRVVSGSFTPKLVDGSGNSCSGSSCRLRLTDTGTNEATQVSYIKQGFPFGTNKVTAEFDYWSYGGSKADGIAIVFSDPNDPAGNNPPTAGGFGGSLGYANRDGVNGFTGGWIGLGLDEYGNYANPTEGRTGSGTGSGWQQSSVAIRDAAARSYAFLAGNNSWSKTADGANDSDKNYRYRITLDGTGGGGNSAVVTVERDTSGTGNSYQTQLTYTTGAPPAQLQFSTTGSTGASTNNHEIANLKICYQTSSDLPPPSTGAKPANFNCVESGASASTGHLYTKLAGTAFSFDVVALKADGSVETAYAADADKPVKVELVDGSGTTACASRTAINPAVSQTLTFTKAASGTEKGRKATANMTVSNANKDVLCRVTDANQTPSIVGCSIDHFAVRPSAVTLGVSPTMATPPLASAANPIKAGAAFTVNATTSPAAGYSGSLSLDTSKLSAQTTTQGTTIQSGGVVGTLSPPTLAANPATSPSNNASYTEVGYLYLAPGAYRDDSYTGVDQPSGCAATNSCDCVTDTTNDANLSDALASGKYGCSIGNTANYSFGRFTPDHFDVSVAANGAIQKVCSNSFTYTGQAMSYATAPSLTIKAMNALATPTVTQNYAGVFQKLAASGVTITAPTADGTQKGKDGATKTVISPSMSAGTLANSSGTLTYTLASGDQYTYTRDANALVGAYTSDIPLVVASVSDGEVSAAGTLPTLKPTGVSLRFGRLKISNAYGSDKSDLQVPVQAQYWSGLTWVKNADDSCTPIAKAAVKLTGALSANNAVSAGVTLSNGAASIVLKCPYATCPPASKPDTPLVGSVGVCVDIGADPASGVACSATSAAMPWLQGKWPPGSNYDNDPTARATFGVYSAETKKSVHVRELY